MVFLQMIDVLSKVFPILVLFVLASALRKGRIFKKADGHLFLRTVFFLTLPALAFQSFASIPLKIEMFILPFSAGIVMGITILFSHVIAKKLKLATDTAGVFILGSSIMNTGFVLPFIVSVYQNEGLVRANLFDFGNSFLIFTLVYSIAVKHSKNKSKKLSRELLKMPPLWAMLLGIFCAYFHLDIPVVVNETMSFVGQATMPLIILALGIYFSPKMARIHLVLMAVLIRFLVGGILGLSFAYFLPLDPLSKTVLVVSAAAPVGYNTLLFAEMEQLDIEFASNIVSIGIFLGLIITPLCLALFRF